MYPDELRYHEGHAWVRQDGDELTVGVSQYAVDEMGEIIFAELPEEGSEVEREEPYGSIESAKAVEDLIGPVSGEVIRVNDEAGDAPETINEDCYGEGWLIVIKAADEADVDDLLTADEYRVHVGDGGGDDDAEDDVEEADAVVDLIDDDE